MPKKVTPAERDKVLSLLSQGMDRDTIAAVVGVTPGQVSAISAHVSMGTYALPEPEGEAEADSEPIFDAPERTSNMLRMLQELGGAPGRETRLPPIPIGVDAETGEEVLWNPDPGSGSANPHVLGSVGKPSFRAET